MTTHPVRARITEKRPWLKKHFNPKKHPKFLMRLILIWEQATFFFEQLFPVVARTWLGAKSVCLFLGPNFRFLAQKSDFCHSTPILVDGPFLALGETVHFPPCERFFNFRFSSYSRFRKKKTVDPSPSPLWGYRLPVTALVLRQCHRLTICFFISDLTNQVLL